jgi:hypothetical protein
MKILKVVLALVVVLAGVFTAESALAWRRGHSHIGIGLHFGVPIGGWGYYYPPPYYYYPPYYPQTVVVPAQPQVYIEQGGQSAAPPAQGYWYYCADSRAYYPYVKDCPGGWQRVAPQPQN